VAAHLAAPPDDLQQRIGWRPGPCSPPPGEATAPVTGFNDVAVANPVDEANTRACSLTDDELTAALPLCQQRERIG